MLCSIVNLLCILEEPIAALKLCDEMLRQEAPSAVPPANPLDICSFPFAYSRAFRICIQMGNIDDAEKYHEFVVKVCAGVPNHPILMIQKGLMHFARGRYQLALDVFAVVVKTDYDFSLLNQFISLGVSLDELLVSAANDMAVSALHCCEVRLGVNCIEALIERDPARFMTDAIIFNLCTLYDLAHNNIYR